MNKNNDGSLTLYCFSPAVTLATFIVEMLLAVYVWFRYRATRFGRLSAIFLFSLSVFQLSESLLCRGIGDVLTLIRVGFLGTVFLPAIGLDMIGMITGKRHLVKLGYLLATAVALVIAFVPSTILRAHCPGNFVVFDFGDTFGLVFSFYYAFMMAAGLYELVSTRRDHPVNPSLAMWFLIGYAAILVPPAALYTFAAATRSGFPSIFCGFAIITALILTFKILPLASRLKSM